MATHTWMKKKYTADDVREIQRYMNMINIVSLSTPVGDEGLHELGEFILDESPSIQEKIEEEERQELLIKMVHECLRPREEKVILELYGLKNRKRKTLQQVGDMFGVSRERIRQIELSALKRLKNYISTKNIHSMEDI